MNSTRAVTLSGRMSRYISGRGYRLEGFVNRTGKGNILRASEHGDAETIAKIDGWREMGQRIRGLGGVTEEIIGIMVREGIEEVSKNDIADLGLATSIIEGREVVVSQTIAQLLGRIDLVDTDTLIDRISISTSADALVVGKTVRDLLEYGRISFPDGIVFDLLQKVKTLLFPMLESDIKKHNLPFCRWADFCTNLKRLGEMVNS